MTILRITHIGYACLICGKRHRELEQAEECEASHG